jgi:hypothetical protein
MGRGPTPHGKTADGAGLQVGSPLCFRLFPFSAVGRQLVDRPHQTAGQRVHAPRRGAGRLWGTATRGVRFARPPANFYDPYRGRSAAMAAWGARRHGSAAARPGQIFKFVPRGRTSVSAPWDGFPNLSPLRAQPKTAVDREENQRQGSAAARHGQIFKFVPRGRGPQCPPRWVFSARHRCPGPRAAWRGGRISV